MLGSSKANRKDENLCIQVPGSKLPRASNYKLPLTTGYVLPSNWSHLEPTA